jgi:competence protein ComEC
MRVRSLPDKNHIGLFNGKNIKVYARCIDGNIFKAERIIRKGEIFKVRGKFYLLGRKVDKNGGLFLIKGRMDTTALLNPGFMFYLKNLEVGYILFPEEVKFIGEKNGFLSMIRNNIRKKLQLISVNERRFAFYRAIILGERRGISRKHMDFFKKTGTIHILAISGLHVGLIFLIFYITLRFLRFSKRNSSLLSFLSLYFYLFMVGLKPSLLRAVLFVSSFIISSTLQRKRNYYNCLGFAGLISLLINPKWIFDVGFQLSYLATFGIIGVLPLLRRIEKSGFYIKFIIIPLLVSISAQVFTLPLVAYRFGIISLVSPITNLILTPLIFLILSQLEISFIFMGIHPSLSLPFSTLSNTAVDLIYLTVKLFSSIPNSYIEIKGFSQSLLVILYIPLFLLTFIFRFLKS